MKNPLRSEAAAFNLLLASIAYFAVIVLASLVATWLGVVAFVLATGVAVWLVRGGTRPEPTVVHVEPGGDIRRVLVVANETLGGRELHELVARRVAGRPQEVRVVCPALNSRVRTWVSDEDPARAAAQARLDASLARLAEAGIEARGEVGDGDPLQAIEDALVTFPADEIVLSTHPEGRSHWLERGVVAAAEQRFDVPVWHVVVEDAVA